VVEKRLRTNGLAEASIGTGSGEVCKKWDATDSTADCTKHNLRIAAQDHSFEITAAKLNVSESKTLLCMMPMR